MEVIITELMDIIITHKFLKSLQKGILKNITLTLLVFTNAGKEIFPELTFSILLDQIEPIQNY